MDKKMIMLNKQTENIAYEQLYSVSSKDLKSILETSFTLLGFSMDTLFKYTRNSPLQKDPLLFTFHIVIHKKERNFTKMFICN